uniref:ribosomal protein S5 n=1 Tax=Dixoniella grisea TaxID=35153 RepID=UPI001FCDE770|nr:ribosomal protein S5 [Dixoniella grisea]UNJ17158.1 ribosomal protein S5 [Dixoniella grisea]
MINRTKKFKKKVEKNKLHDKVVQIRRVTKVVKGGKKISFRAIIVIGNKKGKVGVGIGKASDVMGAVKKGMADAKKQIISIPLTKFNSIPHIMYGKSGSATIIVRPSAPGSGVIAGSSIRSVLELAGVSNILAKQLGSKNPLNNARATIDALSKLRTFSEVAAHREIPLQQMY